MLTKKIARVEARLASINAAKPQLADEDNLRVAEQAEIKKSLEQVLSTLHSDNKAESETVIQCLIERFIANSRKRQSKVFEAEPHCAVVASSHSAVPTPQTPARPHQRPFSCSQCGTGRWSCDLKSWHKQVDHYLDRIVDCLQPGLQAKFVPHTLRAPAPV